MCNKKLSSQKYAAVAVIKNLQGSTKEPTCEEQTGKGNDIELLDSHVVVVHEQVQEVNGQVARRRTEVVAVAEDGEQVCKVAAHANLRGVGPVHRQLQFLGGGGDETGCKHWVWGVTSRRSRVGRTKWWWRDQGPVKAIHENSEPCMFLLSGFNSG